eukprot:TRINITY_DN5418_c0_g1_i1.p2 TRINITY_DN5418_c0_g1~~TRINITY_DN5418_c0_g1_i1.p2  ORF type:complete len:62 (-),score=12.71 TRINITY_DN5418_c0_g1_i1:200-385(-)
MQSVCSAVVDGRKGTKKGSLLDSGEHCRQETIPHNVIMQKSLNHREEANNSHSDNTAAMMH